jgi:hypothetical protein
VQQLKSGRVSGGFDDLDGPLAEFGKGVTQIGAVIDTVGEEMAQPGKQLVDGLDDETGTIAILDIGGVHLGTDRRCRCIGHNVTLTAFDLLGRIVTTRPAALGGLDRLTVDDPADGLGSRPAASRACTSNAKLMFSNRPLPTIVEIALDRRERRKVLRQHPPLTAGPRDIQDRVKHGAQLNLTRPAQRLGRRHIRLDQRPFGIGDIDCVALSLSLILPSSDFGPHLVTR